MLTEDIWVMHLKGTLPISDSDTLRELAGTYGDLRGLTGTYGDLRESAGTCGNLRELRDFMKKVYLDYTP